MWERIKKILQKEGGKCIIISENEPTYLVMRLEDYEKAVKSGQSQDTEKINRDIAEWKAEETQKDGVEDTDDNELKVEDLPF